MTHGVRMFHVVLYQPEIPPNTGNIIRLCANTGAALHLVEPLGFELDDAQLRRAGLDYREYARVMIHADLVAAARHFGDARWFAFSTRGGQRYDQVRYCPGDVLLFGPESRGLPDAVLDRVDEGRRLRLPMRPGNRSVNLSNSVAIAVFEAWRQHGFAGSD